MEEEEEEDSLIAELFDSSDEEEIVDQTKRVEEFYALKNRLEREHFLGEEPEELQECILFWLYYAVQFIILFDRFGAHVSLEAPGSMHDKVCFSIMEGYWEKLLIYVHTITQTLYNDVCNRIERHLGCQEGHPMLILMEKIRQHKELHCRHIKTDPGASRTRSDDVQDTYNSVSGELYDPENHIHKSWAELIFNPLPSDYDEREKDPEEGGEDYKTQIELMKLTGTWRVPEPFCIVVTKEWGEAIQFLHSLIHFEAYIITLITDPLTDEERAFIRGTSWDRGWAFLLTEEFQGVPINRLKGGKKKIPHVVANLIALREFFKKLVTFTKLT